MKSKILFWINEIDGRFRDMVLLVSSYIETINATFGEKYFLYFDKSKFCVQVKEWAKARDINDSKSGSLNSYALSLLIIFHFQVSFY